LKLLCRWPSQTAWRFRPEPKSLSSIASGDWEAPGSKAVSKTNSRACRKSRHTRRWIVVVWVAPRKFTDPWCCMLRPDRVVISSTPPKRLPYSE
jgi:hypothetical protein